MTLKDIKSKVIQRDGKCVQCGATEDLTVDHIIPLSRGGLYTMDNLQTLCARCNRNKGSRINWPWSERITHALHVDALLQKAVNDMNGTISSLRGNIVFQVEKQMQSRIDQAVAPLKREIEDLRKQLEGEKRGNDFRYKQMRALEHFLKVEWYEEVNEGYKNI